MRRTLLVALACRLMAAAAPASTTLPSWLTEAITRQAPKYPAKVAAVVLHQEENLSVDSSGRRKMTERGAIRILQPGGSHGIAAYRSYITKTGRIPEFQAWLISPSGKPAVIAKDRILDVAGSGGELNDESRAKLVECPGDVQPGSVFAWEVLEEESTVFTQYHYSFQHSQPVLLSRFSITLPAGWEVNGIALNHAPLEPRIAGATTSWELTNLPPLEFEEYSPGWVALAPRLGVSYFPAEGSGNLRPLKDWKAVSSWLTDLSDPSVTVTPEIKSKAEALIAGSATEAEKIAAVAAFVQQTTYVSVQLNTSRGGGYSPHPAPEVLRKNYGDCKDKVALMRALLRAVGIESYDVSIFSGSRLFVQPQWPATLQFNHAIIAVKVGSSTGLPTVLDHPALGRMLLFDPTDPGTPLGDLPTEEQGSFALIQAGLHGELVKVPRLPAKSSRSETTVAARYTTTGGIEADSLRQYYGQAATGIRRITASRDPVQLKKYFETSLQQRLGSVTLKSIDPEDQKSRGSFQLHTVFAAGRFGQIMQNRLLILQPGLLANAGLPVLQESERTQPILLKSLVRKESVRLEIPAEFKLDEMPAPIDEESPYGTYHASWNFENSLLTFSQMLEVKDTLASASELPAIRAFLEKAAGGAGSTVVFVKK